MKTKRNGNPGKRLPGFFHILNLLPIAQMENTFWVEMESLRFIRLSSPRCSTVKIGSKRDKLLLKTLIIPRVGLNKKLSSFFIYATISPFSLTSGFATLTTPPFPFAFSGATYFPPKGKSQVPPAEPVVLD